MLKIEAIESGRLAPVPRAWTFDSSKAGADEEVEIMSLLGATDFFRAPEPKSLESPDRGLLSIHVELDGQSRRLTLPCGAVPNELAPHVSFIESRLEWRPRP
jgi:hypothetical protein